MPSNGMIKTSSWADAGGEGGYRDTVGIPPLKSVYLGRRGSRRTAIHAMEDGDIHTIACVHATISFARQGGTYMPYYACIMHAARPTLTAACLLGSAFSAMPLWPRVRPVTMEEDGTKQRPGSTPGKSDRFVASTLLPPTACRPLVDLPLDAASSRRLVGGAVAAGVCSLADALASQVCAGVDEDGDGDERAKEGSWRGAQRPLVVIRLCRGLLGRSAHASHIPSRPGTIFNWVEEGTSATCSVDGYAFAFVWMCMDMAVVVEMEGRRSTATRRAATEGRAMRRARSRIATWHVCGTADGAWISRAGGAGCAMVRAQVDAAGRGVRGGLTVATRSCRTTEKRTTEEGGESNATCSLMRSAMVDGRRLAFAFAFVGMWQDAELEKD
ncbi:hypothetical protein B0H12DRAFT_1070644 [Mycena haematopus]|nr:hypothetical protein B0H12DRAFT_1070644 [Mycena haematopus]